MLGSFISTQHSSQVPNFQNIVLFGSCSLLDPSQACLPHTRDLFLSGGESVLVILGKPYGFSLSFFCSFIFWESDRYYLVGWGPSSPYTLCSESDGMGTETVGGVGLCLLCYLDRWHVNHTRFIPNKSWKQITAKGVVTFPEGCNFLPPSPTFKQFYPLVLQATHGFGTSHLAGAYSSSCNGPFSCLQSLSPSPGHVIPQFHPPLEHLSPPDACPFSLCREKKAGLLRPATFSLR